LNKNKRKRIINFSIIKLIKLLLILFLSNNFENSYNIFGKVDSKNYNKGFYAKLRVRLVEHIMIKNLVLLNIILVMKNIIFLKK
jgi:hypothetical protein